MEPNKMELKKVHVILRTNALKRVERRLEAMHVQNISVTHVKEYGEHEAFFAFRAVVRMARLEIFAEADRAEEIAAAILDEAHTDLPSDGFVAILPVEKMYRIGAGIAPEGI